MKKIKNALYSFATIVFALSVLFLWDYGVPLLFHGAKTHLFAPNYPSSAFVTIDKGIKSNEFKTAIKVVNKEGELVDGNVAGIITQKNGDQDYFCISKKGTLISQSGKLTMTKKSAGLYLFDEEFPKTVHVEVSLMDHFDKCSIIPNKRFY